MRSPRFLAVVLFLVGAIVLLQWRGDVDHVPASTPLAQFPSSLGPWDGVSIPIDQETLDVLGKGIFLSRNYAPVPAEASGPKALYAQPVSLFIGYFPTQRSGQSIHSPQNCLPGAGWTFESSSVVTVENDNGKPMQVGEYVIANGTTKAEVLYWYQSQGHSIASDYKAKLYMLADSIRYGRTDAALVRILTPIPKGESQTDAHERAIAFARRISPLLPAYIPD